MHRGASVFRPQVVVPVGSAKRSTECVHCAYHNYVLSLGDAVPDQNFPNVLNKTYFFMTAICAMQFTRGYHPCKLQRQSPQRAVCGVSPHGAHERVGSSDQQPIEAHSLEIVPGVGIHCAILDREVCQLADRARPQDGLTVFQSDATAAERHRTGQEQAEDR